MKLPKLNAILFCMKAVLTEPWWNLVGVFDTCLANSDGQAQFDAFLKFGDMRSDQDSTVTLKFVDPVSLDVLYEIPAIIRGDSGGVAERSVLVDVEFPRDDDYHVEVLVDGNLVDVVILRVYVSG